MSDYNHRNDTQSLTATDISAIYSLADRLQPAAFWGRLKRVPGGRDKNRPKDLLPGRDPTVETALRKDGKGRGRGDWIRVARHDPVIGLAGPSHRGITRARRAAAPRSVIAGPGTNAAAQHGHGG